MGGHGATRRRGERAGANPLPGTAQGASWVPAGRDALPLLRVTPNAIRGGSSLVMLHSLPVVQPAPSVSSLARLRLTRPGKKIPSQHRQVSVTPVAMASPLPADPAKTRVG